MPRKTTNPAGRSRYTTLLPTKSEKRLYDKVRDEDLKLYRGPASTSWLKQESLDPVRRVQRPTNLWSARERPQEQPPTSAPMGFYPGHTVALSPTRTIGGQVTKPSGPEPDWIQRQTSPAGRSRYQTLLPTESEQEYIPRRAPYEGPPTFGSVRGPDRIVGPYENMPDFYPRTARGLRQWRQDQTGDLLKRDVVSGGVGLGRPADPVTDPSLTVFGAQRKVSVDPAVQRASMGGFGLTGGEVLGDIALGKSGIPDYLTEAPGIRGTVWRDTDRFVTESIEKIVEPVIYSPLEEDPNRYNVLAREGDYWVVEDLKPEQGLAFDPELLKAAEEEHGIPEAQNKVMGDVTYLPVRAERAPTTWQTGKRVAGQIIGLGLHGFISLPQAVKRPLGAGEAKTTPMLKKVLLADGTYYDPAFEIPEGAIPVLVKDHVDPWVSHYQTVDGGVVPAYRTLGQALEDVFPDDPDFWEEAILETSKLTFQPEERLEAAIRVHDVGMAWDEAIHGVPDVMVQRLIPLGYLDPKIGAEKAIKADPYTNYYYNKRKAQLLEEDPTLGPNQILGKVIGELEIQGLPGSQSLGISMLTDIIFDPLNLLNPFAWFSTAAKARQVARINGMFSPNAVKLVRGVAHHIDAAGRVGNVVENTVQPLRVAEVMAEAQQLYRPTKQLVAPTGRVIGEGTRRTINQFAGWFQANLWPFQKTAQNIADDVQELGSDAVGNMLEATLRRETEVDAAGNLVHAVNPITGKPYATTREVAEALINQAIPRPDRAKLASEGARGSEIEELIAAHDALIKASDAVLTEIPVASSRAGRMGSALLHGLVSGPEGVVDASKLTNLLPIKLDDAGKIAGDLKPEDVALKLLERFQEVSETLLIPERKGLQTIQAWVNAGNKAQDYPVFARGIEGARERFGYASKFVDKPGTYQVKTTDYPLHLWGQLRRGITGALWWGYGRLNPGYSARNLYNNWVTMMADGHFTLEPRHIIDGWFAQKGITLPRAARRGIGSMGASLPDASSVIGKADNWSFSGQTTVKIAGLKIPIGAQAVESAMAKRIVYTTMKKHLDDMFLKRQAIADLSDTSLFGVTRPDGSLGTVLDKFEAADALDIIDDLYRKVAGQDGGAYGDPHAALQWLKERLRITPSTRLSKLFPSGARYMENNTLRALQKFPDGDYFSGKILNIIMEETDPLIAASKLDDVKVELLRYFDDAGRHTPLPPDTSVLEESIVLQDDMAAQVDLLSGPQLKAARMSTDEFLQATAARSELYASKQRHASAILERAGKEAVHNPALVQDVVQQRVALDESIRPLVNKAKRAHRDLLKKARADHDELAKHYSGRELYNQRGAMWKRFEAKREEIWQGYYERTNGLYDEFIERYTGANSEFTIDGVNRLAFVPEHPAYDPAQMRTISYVLDDMIERVRSYEIEGIQQIVKLDANDWKVLENWANQTETLSNEAKVIAGQVGKAARDDALLRYGDRRNIDNWLSNVYPFHFWYSRTVNNWIERTTHRPAVMANYLRYRQHMRNIHGGLSPYWQQQLSTDDFGIDWDNPWYVNVEASLSPLYQQMGVQFSSAARRDAQFLGWKGAGTMLEELGSYGPTPWAVWGLALALANKKSDPEASAAWMGHTAPVFRTLRHLTAPAEGILGIPPGGVNLDPQVALSNAIRAGSNDNSYGRSMTRWETNRMVQFMMEQSNNPPDLEQLRDMYSVPRSHEYYQQYKDFLDRVGAEGLNQESWHSQLLIEAYRNSGPAWDQALRTYFQGEILPVLASQVGGAGFRGRSGEMQRMEDAYLNLQHIRNQYESLDPREISQLYREHYAMYPEMEMASMIRGSQWQRNDAAIWSSISREGFDWDMLNKQIGESTLDNFFKLKTSRFMAPAQAEELLVAALEIGEILKVKTPEDVQDFMDVSIQLRNLDEDLEDEFGADIEEFNDEFHDRASSHGYAEAKVWRESELQSDDPDRRDLVQRAIAADFEKNARLAADPKLAARNMTKGRYKSHLIDVWKRGWRQKQGETTLADGTVLTFDEVIDAYKKLPFATRRDWLESNPGLAWYADYEMDKDLFYADLPTSVNAWILTVQKHIKQAELSQFALATSETKAAETLMAEFEENQIALPMEVGALSPNANTAVQNQIIAYNQKLEEAAEVEAAKQTYMDRHRKTFEDGPLAVLVRKAGGTTLGWNDAREEPQFGGEWPEPFSNLKTNAGVEDLVAFVNEYKATGLREAMMKEAIANGLTLENVAWNILSAVKALKPEEALALSTQRMELHDIEMVFAHTRQDEEPDWDALLHAMGFRGHVSSAGDISIKMQGNVDRLTSAELERLKPTYFDAEKDEHLDNFTSRTQGWTQLDWEEERVAPLMARWPVDSRGKNGLIAYVKQLGGTGLRHAMMLETSNFPKQGDKAWRVIGTILNIDPDALNKMARRYPELHDIEMVYWSAYTEGYPTLDALYAAMGFRAEMSIDGKASYYRLSGVERLTKDQIKKEGSITGSLITDADDRFISNSDVHEYIRRLASAEIGHDVDLKVQNFDALNLDGQYDEAIALYNSDPRIAAFIALRDEIWDRFEASKAGPGSKKFAKFFKALAAGERTEDIGSLIVKVMEDAGAGTLTRTSAAIEKAASAKADTEKGGVKRGRTPKRSILYNFVQRATRLPELEPGGFAKRQEAMMAARQPSAPSPQADITLWTSLLESLQTSNPSLLTQIQDYFDLSAYARQAHLQRNPNLARWLATIPAAQLAAIERAYYIWAQQTGRLTPRQERRVSRSRPALASTLRVYKPRGARAGI